MLRLAFVIHELTRGGAERVLVSLAKHYAQSGAEVNVVLFGSKIDYNIEGVNVISLSIGSKSHLGLAKIAALFRLLRTLRRTIKDLAPDYVISFGDQNNLLTILAAFGTGLKLIVSDRVFPAKGPLLQGIQSEFLRRTMSQVRDLIYSRVHAVVVPSSEMAECYHLSNLRIIENPVATPQLSNLSSQNKPVIIAAGRLVKQKRFDLLISAFAKIAREHPTWSLRIFGDGELREELIARVESEQIPRVEIQPNTPNLSQEFSDASIFVLSSDFEGFPNTLLEAMAHGLAVVATRCPTGPASIISNTADGILIPIGDTEALYRALDGLIRDPKIRREIGLNAAKSAQRYTIKNISEKWDHLFQH